MPTQTGTADNKVEFRGPLSDTELATFERLKRMDGRKLSALMPSWYKRHQRANMPKPRAEAPDPIAALMRELTRQQNACPHKQYRCAGGPWDGEQVELSSDGTAWFTFQNATGRYKLKAHTTRGNGRYGSTVLIETMQYEAAK